MNKITKRSMLNTALSRSAVNEDLCMPARRVLDHGPVTMTTRLMMNRTATTRRNTQQFKQNLRNQAMRDGGMMMSSQAGCRTLT